MILISRVHTPLREKRHVRGKDKRDQGLNVSNFKTQTLPVTRLLAYLIYHNLFRPENKKTETQDRRMGHTKFNALTYLRLVFESERVKQNLLNRGDDASL